MGSHLSAKPVWAGVAVRLDDGTLRTYELGDGHSIDAMIEVDREHAERHPDGRPWREWDPDTYVERVRITVSGVAHRWAGVPADAGQSRPGVEPPTRTLPGEEHSGA